MTLLPRSAFTIGNRNPYIGHNLTALWMRPWGGHPIGYKVSGKLRQTFVVAGRTLIGEVEVLRDDGSYRIVSAPWSKNFIKLYEGSDNVQSI